MHLNVVQMIPLCQNIKLITFNDGEALLTYKDGTTFLISLSSTVIEMNRH